MHVPEFWDVEPVLHFIQFDLRTKGGGPLRNKWTIIVGVLAALAVVGIISVGAASASSTPKGNIALVASNGKSFALGSRVGLSRFSAINSSEGAVAGKWCLNGVTVVTGEDVSPFILWLDPAFAIPLPLDDSLAQGFNFFANQGRPFRLFNVDEEGNVGDPITDFNYVSIGACGSKTAVFTDRNFWLCFSKSRNPAVYSRGVAVNHYKNDNYTVPVAVQSPVSDTNIGNGVYLTCSMPAGMSVKQGVAVSTGGGDVTTGPPDLVSYMLGSMPLDYTVLVGP